MASSRHRRRNDPRAVPNAAPRAVGPALPATGPQVRSNNSGNTSRPSRFRAWVIADAVGTVQAASQQPPVQRPGHLGRDLGVVVVREQAQRQRQVRDHVRGQLPVRALLPHPAHRDRLIDRSRGTASTSTPNDT